MPAPASAGSPTSSAALALADQVDVLIHDAQHTAAEFATVSGFGHSTLDYAVRLAEDAGARTMVLFHHAPSRTDDELDRLSADLGSFPGVIVGREPLELLLP